MTVLELLVVLSVIGAALAISLPLALRSLERSSFQSAQAAIIAALDEARAHAQRERVMVEVLVDRGGRRVRAQECGVDGSPLRRIGHIEVLLESPLAVRVVTDAARPAPDAAVDTAGPSDRAESQEGVLALFLPDGAAPLARRAVLQWDGRTEAVVTVRRLIGRATSLERRVPRAGWDPHSESDEDADANLGGPRASPTFPEPGVR